MQSRFISIAGTGNYIPNNVVTSLQLDAKLGKPEGWVEDKSGVKSRRFITAETTSFMAAKATEKALAASGINALELDCIVSASGTMEQAIPCTAALVQKQLGLEGSKIACFDVNSTCLSFLTALDTVSALISVGRYRKVLIVSSDIPSVGLKWDHMESCLIFGDGAAAMVVTAPEEGKAWEVVGSHMETYSEAADACRVRAGGTRYNSMTVEDNLKDLFYFEMDGKVAFRVSAEHIDSFVQKLFKGSNLTLEDMDIVVPHQASKLAMHHLRKRLGIPEDRLVDIFSDHGNQVAASIPTAFHTALSKGRIKPGQHVLLIGTGAGISIAGMVLRAPT